MRGQGRYADEVRRLVLGRRLPLPGYLRSDGAGKTTITDALRLTHPSRFSAFPRQSSSALGAEEDSDGLEVRAHTAERIRAWKSWVRSAA